jgi:alkylhydroperoxidase/carboxymuconolactone decarboxylase family protein
LAREGLVRRPGLAANPVRAYNFSSVVLGPPQRPAPPVENKLEHYYDAKDLPRFPEIAKDAPEMGKKFFDWAEAVMEEGALTKREKSLIALAVAHAVQCPYCMDAYTQTCLEQGSDMAEMTEALHVAAYIRGGATLVHGIQMRNQAKKLSM